MKSFVLTILAILLALPLSGQEEKAEKAAIGKVSFPLNRVFVIAAGTSKLQIARFNMPLYQGDKIETKRESRCEITLNNGDVIRIDENSLFTVESYSEKDSSTAAESSLSIGRIWANIRRLFSDDAYFKVKSPSAVIAVRGTIYRVDAAEDQSTQVRVYEGAVAVEPAGSLGGVKSAPDKNTVGRPGQILPPQQIQPPQEVPVEQWMEIIKEQQQIVVKPDGSFETETFDIQADADLDWVQWNKRRDRMLFR